MTKAVLTYSGFIFKERDEEMAAELLSGKPTWEILGYNSPLTPTPPSWARTNNEVRCCSRRTPKWWTSSCRPCSPWSLAIAIVARTLVKGCYLEACINRQAKTTCSDDHADIPLLANHAPCRYLVRSRSVFAFAEKEGAHPLRDDRRRAGTTFARTVVTWAIVPDVARTRCPS